MAAVGIYGVSAFSVSRRGPRWVYEWLWAQEVAISVRLIVRNSMMFEGIGMAIGLVGAVILGRFLSGRLFGVSALDPAVFTSVTIVLGLAALVASYLPARRATRVEPIEALRVE